MSSNNLSNSIIINSQLNSKNSTFSKQSNLTPSKNSLSLENNKLFEFTLEMAINSDLILPSKDKDFSYFEKDSLYTESNSFGIKTPNKIDKNKLGEIMKIISKYNN